MFRTNRSEQRGSVMLVTAISLVLLIGMLGLSVDVGRVYIVKNEAQAFADLATVAACRHLNAKQTGIDAANAEVVTAATTNKWDFSTQAFATAIRTVNFQQAKTGPGRPPPLTQAERRRMRITRLFA